MKTMSANLATAAMFPSDGFAILQSCGKDPRNPFQ